MSEAKSPLGKVKTRMAKPAKTDAKPEKALDVQNRVMRLTYSSTSQIAQHFKDEPILRDWLAHFIGRGLAGWIDGQFTPEKAVDCATLGLADNVPLIMAERERAQRLDVQVSFPSWEPDVVGAFPDVPAFCAGEPACMRRLVNQVSDTRPIRIFVGMASSCTFTPAQLAKRGALVSALALQLSKTRVVDVYAINSGRKTFTKGALSGQAFDWSVLVKLPKPVSAADLSYWLCSQASVRGLLYACERAFSGPLSWPNLLSGYDDYSTPAAIRAQALLWGANDSDIVVPFPYSNSSAQAEMLAKPETWLKNTLARVNAIAA